MTRRLPWALDARADAPFPPAETALREPDGLLAVGGDLTPVRLLNAYAGGVFPWFSDGQPLLWWSPDPRMVFRTDGVRLSSRFRRSLRASSWVVRADTRFAEVIAACATSFRPGQDGTWITDGGSKVALAALAHRLAQWGWPLIDAQVENDHLLSMGAEHWPRARFLALVREQVRRDAPAGSWTERFGELAAAALA